MILRLKFRIWSQNARDKAHFGQRASVRKRWHILLLAKLGGRQEPPCTKRRVTITSYRCALIHDHGNLVGGAKELVDAMVAVGLLRDDADGWASIRYEQVKCPRVDEHTAIEIDDVDVAPTPAQQRRAARMAARSTRRVTRRVSDTIRQEVARRVLPGPPCREALCAGWVDRVFPTGNAT